MTDIDWAEVRRARRRGKCGTLQPGDQELLVRAFKADRKRYKELDAEVIKEVTEEVRSFWVPKEWRR